MIEEIVYMLAAIVLVIIKLAFCLFILTLFWPLIFFALIVGAILSIFGLNVSVKTRKTK